MSGIGFAKRLTLENLDSFAALLRRPASRPTPGAGERGAEDNPNADERDADVIAAESLFQGVHLRVSIPFRRRSHRTVSTAPQQAPEESIAEPENLIRGPLVWRKQLVASDVQRQPGNPTGGVRLTQAKFRVNDVRIDQTSYFRELFGDFAWTDVPGRVAKEDAIVPFEISIPARGVDLGLRHLNVSHKPSGAAGQHNYTTILQWTDITGTIRDLNLTGCTLSMYGPPPGETEPFFIEIT